MKRAIESSSDESDDYLNFEIEDNQPTTTTYAQQRNKAALIGFLKNQKSKQYIAKETLDQSLANPLTAENKGYQMLEKMGYNPGTALGISGSLIEPIPIDIKSDKKGLGIKDSTGYLSIKQQKIVEGQLESKKQDFQATMTNRYDERLLRSDLNKTRVCIMNMDSIHGKSRNLYWPLEQKRIDLLQDTVQYTENELTIEQQEYEEKNDYTKLVLANEYLRNNYFFCIWCSCSYDDYNDLQENCPGTEREDHDDV